MTTYAYDNWIQLPTRDLYDTQVMAMAINAAKDMYEKGEQRIKDFNTAYGDFVTPIQADQDWYNQNVTGKVRDTINNLYARGIDPLRSAEGRAIVAQLVNNIPVGQVAKLRSSAENAKAFLKSRQELEAKGLYNPLFAKYDGPDMATYHTLEDESGAGMGIWERMSPTRITDMATFGNPYFEGMKPNIHSASKNGVSYSIEKIDENDLRAIADAHYNELVSTPQGQLMYKYYTDLAGGDPVKARQMFNDAVVDGQRRRIYQKDDYDDQWAKRQQISQGWAKINQDREQFNWKKFTDSVQLGLIDSPTTSNDLSYTTQMETNSIAQYNKKAGVNSPADYAKTTQDIAQYWKKVADKETSKDKKAHATDLYNLWNKISAAGLDSAEKYGVLVKDKNTGELIPSKMYTRGIGYAYGAKSTGATTTNKAREQADIYYNRYLSTSGGTEYDKTSADLLAGGSGEQKSFPGGAATNKYRTVAFDDKDIYFTPLRRMQVAGYNIDDKNSAKLLKAFDEWLHGSPRIGYMVNSNTTRASLPTNNGGRTREISGYARIPHEEFDEFVRQYKKEHPTVDSQSIYDALGLSFFKINGRKPIGGKNQWVEADVVEIPITRVRINANSLEDAAWNTHHDVQTGGKSKAEGKIISRQKESLNKR